MTEENPFAGQGSVLLDIGGDVGAVVVTMPPEMLGVEVDIRPAGSSTVVHQHTHDHGDGRDHSHGTGHHPHVAVVNRPAPGGFIPSLVYAEVVEGSYELCLKDTDDAVLAVDVRGGEVTETSWPQG